MAYNALNNLIDAYIYANGVQAITGSVLNGVLKAMVAQLGEGYPIFGVATPSTRAAINDEPMAYFAATAGTYLDFGGITLDPGEVAVLLTSGNGVWAKQTIYTVPTDTGDLTNEAGFITAAVSDLVNYYTKTEMDLELGEIDSALENRYTKAETDTKLGDYYRKAETYDKDEVDSIIATLSRQEYIVAWDGSTAPDVAAIPAGVTVTYSGTTYTGTLAASASTVNKIYMVWNGTAYDMYATSQDSGFSWVPMGTTTVDLSQYATKAELKQLRQDVQEVWPLADWDPVDGYIISDSWYEWNKSVFINVEGRMKFRIKANGETAQFAFLTEIPTILHDPVSYATGSTRTDVYGTGEMEGDIPSNAKYMWVAIDQSGTNRTPAALVIDDYQYTEDVVYNIQQKTSFDGSEFMRVFGSLPSGDLDDVVENGTWVIDSGNIYTNLPGNITTGFLRTSIMNNITLQECYDFSTERLFKRRAINGTYGDWVQIGIIADYSDFMRMDGSLPSGDLNDVTETGTWVIDSGNTYQNIPGGNTTGFLRSSVINNVKLQEFYDFNGASLYKRRCLNTNWGEWKLISGGGGGGVENYYTFNEYQQTVNVSASPTITADTNNYLATTGDTTDRTADILALLATVGTCHLGPGQFHVKNLVLPNNTSIIGSGVATRVVLDSSVSDGFAIKMGSNCSLRNLTMDGLQGSPHITVGTRHGILWQGDYTQSQTAPLASMVSDLFIRNFNGGGITCYDTGYGTFNFLDVCNVTIDNCDAGINISYWSEYHKFTNVRTYNCYFGCINNGGNNIFVNCDFSSCQGKAFVMDNSQQQSPNNSHGSCIGCVFNHTASNTGVGIEILGCDSGFVFTGCQIFFSKINIVDSLGIVIADCNFGKNNCDITVSGGGAILFANNMHQDTPPSITVTGNNNVHFVNCYNRATGALISA